MKYTIRLIICCLLISVRLQALSPELEIISKKAVTSLQDKVSFYGSKNFTDLIKTLPRNQRKEVCLHIMNTLKETDPVSSFSAANCLLYNGYGKLAIPFFAEFASNGNNEKHLKGRMGYGWLHSGDWFEVGPKILSDMTNHQDLFTWIQSQIRQETLSYPKKYGPVAVQSSLNQIFRLHLKFNPPTESQAKLKDTCNNISINIEDYKCKFNKKSNALTDCTIYKSDDSELIECE